MKKRILSILLVLFVVATFLPGSVNAGVMPSASSTITRYTVLVLDVSGSMYGTPLQVLKTAANKFCEIVLQASGQNYVAIVTYSDSAATIINFSSNLTTLQNSINNIISSGNTNTTSGLQLADSLLSAIADAPYTIKNLLLLSDGMPNTGAISSGPYTSNDYLYYSYANASYNAATTFKDKGNSRFLYSLGFFHSLVGNDLTFARRFMNDLQNAGYYDVVDANNLEFVFKDLAKRIKQSGKFKYTSVFSSVKDYEAVYYYDDGYFYNSSYTYNINLATMSLCLAMSAFASNEVNNPYKSNNARDLLIQTGFSDFAVNSGFTVPPTTDSIGVVAASKSLQVDTKSYTLIAVAIRGGGYEQEWSGNFNLGERGQHLGFESAKIAVSDFVKSYIVNHKITGDIKLWITGYSRAAATANLMAGAIDGGEILGNCSLNPLDLYAYTFETPKGAILVDQNDPFYNTSKNPRYPIYNNIFNIVNVNDAVPLVAPAELKFTRFGIDKTLSDVTDSNYKDALGSMLVKYPNIASIKENKKSYTVDSFTKLNFKPEIHFISSYPFVTISIPDPIVDSININSQKLFLNDFIKRLSLEEIKNRTNYKNKYQDGICEIEKVLNSSDKNIDKFKEIFIAKLKNIDNLKKLFVSLFPYGERIYGKTETLFEQILTDSQKEASVTVYDKSQIQSLSSIFANIFRNSCEFFTNHPDLFVSLFYNLSDIQAAHYPELCLAWMQSMDINYTQGGGASFSNSNGKYRIIRINCPVDVEVYNASNLLVGGIKSDIPQKVSGSSLITAINEDNEKLVYLPADLSYNLKLIPTASGNMTYSVNEFSSVLGQTNRITNFYDIPINPGSNFTGNVPAFNASEITAVTANASSTVYSVVNSAGRSIAPSDDFKGTAVDSAYYMVSVSANNTAYGMVSGQGIRQLGSYAKVTATPYQDCGFNGWYVNNIKVSMDKVYSFRTNSDIKLVAIFTPPPVNGISIETKNDGTGAVLGNTNIPQGSLITAYSITIDKYRNFIDNAPATWSLTSKTGGVTDSDLTVTGNSTKATFIGHATGTGVIHVVSGNLSADSGIITVDAPISSGGGGGGGGTPSTKKIGVSGFSGATDITVGYNTGIVPNDVTLITLDSIGVLKIDSGTSLRDSKGNVLTSITASRVDSPPASPPPYTILAAYDLGQEGAQFSPPITLTFKNDPTLLSAGVSDQDLEIGYYNGLAWQILDSSRDAGTKTISSKISHFSRFALMGKTTPAPSITAVPTTSGAPVPATVTTPSPALPPSPSPAVEPVYASPAPSPSASTAVSIPATAQTPGVAWWLFIVIIVPVLVIGCIIFIVIRNRRDEP
jgi:hypothetical protein